MSVSPPLRRLSSTASLSSSKREENLINAYEAEEEMIINILSRKLEQLREEKINLERAHEEESESHVNRLSRELSVLRSQQQQQQASQIQTNGSGLHVSHPDSVGRHSPSPEVLLEALKKENETLRSRLVVTERDYIRISRLNEVYREELIEHRRRLGISVDNLIGLSSSTDPLSQPLHRRASVSQSVSSSPTASMIALPSLPPRLSATHSISIPRAPSQSHRQKVRSSMPPSSYNVDTPLSHSPSSSSADSPMGLFRLSPVASPIIPGLSGVSNTSHNATTNTNATSTASTSYSSTNPDTLSDVSAGHSSTYTQDTTPPSSSSLQSVAPIPYNPLARPPLSYPSVPPPSLSSSLDSPIVSYNLRDNSILSPPSISPIDTFSPLRRPSLSTSSNTSSSNTINRQSSFDKRIVETGNFRDIGLNRARSRSSRRESVERGGRVAETGSLLNNRSRTGSFASPSSPLQTQIPLTSGNVVPNSNVSGLGAALKENDETNDTDS